MPDPRLTALLRPRDSSAPIAEGLSNKQIGDRLFLAEKTVRNYVSALLSKLNINAVPKRRSSARKVRRPVP